jgi:nicotinic acid mononucleotide adenylyltransferase
MKSVVFTFGRMNPPTTGHQLLVNKLVAYAKQHGATPRVYLSHSTGKKDPLQYDIKIGFARKAFGAIVKKSNARNVIQILQSLEKDKFTDVTMIVGSDRVPEFKKLLNAYNGKEYNFDKITIVSAGERDPDADDVSGMSASKMRAHAVDNKDAEFMRGAPSTLKAQTRKQMLIAVRKLLFARHY